MAFREVSIHPVDNNFYSLGAKGLFLLHLYYSHLSLIKPYMKNSLSTGILFLVDLMNIFFQFSSWWYYFRTASVIFLRFLKPFVTHLHFSFMIHFSTS